MMESRKLTWKLPLNLLPVGNHLFYFQPLFYYGGLYQPNSYVFVVLEGSFLIFRWNKIIHKEEI